MKQTPNMRNDRQNGSIALQTPWSASRHWEYWDEPTSCSWANIGGGKWLREVSCTQPNATQNMLIVPAQDCRCNRMKGPNVRSFPLPEQTLGTGAARRSRNALINKCRKDDEGVTTKGCGKSTSSFRLLLFLCLLSVVLRRNLPMGPFRVWLAELVFTQMEITA
jgi:hypothetical protein